MSEDLSLAEQTWLYQLRPSPVRWAAPEHHQSQGDENHEVPPPQKRKLKEKTIETLSLKALTARLRRRELEHCLPEIEADDFVATLEAQDTTSFADESRWDPKYVNESDDPSEVSCYWGLIGEFDAVPETAWSRDLQPLTH